MKSLSSLLGELIVIIIFSNLILAGIYFAAVILQAIVEIVR